MRHGLIGQCYARMWAPLRCLPAQVPQAFECPTAMGTWTFSSSWRRDLNTQFAAATSDTWARFVCIVSHCATSSYPGDSNTFLCTASSHPLHFCSFDTVDAAGMC